MPKIEARHLNAAQAAMGVGDPRVRIAAAGLPIEVLAESDVGALVTSGEMPVTECVMFLAGIAVALAAVKEAELDAA